MLVIALLIVAAGFAMPCGIAGSVKNINPNPMIEDTASPAEEVYSEYYLDDYTDRVEKARQKSKHILWFSNCRKVGETFYLYARGFKKVAGPLALPDGKLDHARMRAIVVALIGLLDTFKEEFVGDPFKNAAFYNKRSNRALFTLSSVSVFSTSFSCTNTKNKKLSGYPCTLLRLVENVDKTDPVVQAITSYVDDDSSTFTTSEFRAALVGVRNKLVVPPVYFHDNEDMRGNFDEFAYSRRKQVVLKFTQQSYAIYVVLNKKWEYFLETAGDQSRLSAFVCYNYKRCVGVQELEDGEAFMYPEWGEKEFSLTVKQTTINHGKRLERVVYFIIISVEKSDIRPDGVVDISFLQENNSGFCQNQHGKFYFRIENGNYSQKPLDFKSWYTNELFLNGRPFPQMNIYSFFDPKVTDKSSCLHFESITKNLGFLRPGGEYRAKNWREQIFLVSSDYTFHVPDPMTKASDDQKWAITVREDRVETGQIKLVYPKQGVYYGTNTVSHTVPDFEEIEVKTPKKELEPVYVKWQDNNPHTPGIFKFNLADYNTYSFFILPLSTSAKSKKLLTIKGFEFALSEFGLYGKVQVEFPGVFYAVETKTRKITVLLCIMDSQNKKYSKILKEAVIPENKKTYRVIIKNENDDEDTFELGNESNYNYLSEDGKFLVRGLKLNHMAKYEFDKKCYYLIDKEKSPTDDLVMDFKSCSFLKKTFGNMKKFEELGSLCDEKIWRDYSDTFCDGKNKNKVIHQVI